VHRVARSRRFFVTLFILYVLGLRPLSAEIIAVYINNKPLNVEFVIISDEIFVPADDLLELFHEKIAWDPDTLWIRIGSRELPMKGMLVKDKVFLPLKGLARELGYATSFDAQRGILAIDTREPQAVKEKPAQKDGPKGVSIRLFQEEPITNVLKQVTSLRIFAEVKNDRARPVLNVVAHCIFRYPGGEVFNDDTITIERLEPGEGKRVVFFSSNPLDNGMLEYELKLEIIKKKTE
jgi:hypothetical protein